MITRVGFIGLGAMGGPMAKCIAAKGFPMCVYDVDPVKARTIAGCFADVKAAESVLALGCDCDVVITMLPDANTVASVCKNELFPAMRPGTTWIDMTTGDPFITAELVSIAEEHAIQCLDGPCGRSPKHAENGDLLVLVGGDAQLLEEMRPIISCVATDIIHCGPNGNGHVMKLINNLLSGVIQEANIEAISLGMKAGISVSTMLQVFSDVCVWNGYLAALPYENENAPGWKVTTAAEHMALIQKLGEKYNVPTYTPAIVRERMKDMIARGLGNTKYSNIRTLIKSMAGMEIKEDIKAPVIKEH